MESQGRDWAGGATVLGTMATVFSSILPHKSTQHDCWQGVKAGGKKNRRPIESQGRDWALGRGQLTMLGTAGAKTGEMGVAHLSPLSSTFHFNF